MWTKKFLIMYEICIESDDEDVYIQEIEKFLEKCRKKYNANTFTQVSEVNERIDNGN